MGRSNTMNAPPRLDLDFVRSQFPAFAEPSLHGQAFFENAGGSYACAQVIGLLNEYYRRLKVQPYYSYPAATEAGQWMDRAHVRLGEYLNVAPEEIHLGPSTPQNAYVLAQALRKSLKPGDEVIVTNQEHEANTGVFRRLAADGIIVREWGVERDTGALNPSDLDNLLSGRTKFLAVSHCSNIVARVNPIAQITTKARTVGAFTIVDGVAFAPHGLPDVDALGADIYLFSLYKTFGPHQGVMVVRKPLTEKLATRGTTSMQRKSTSGWCLRDPITRRSRLPAVSPNISMLWTRIIAARTCKADQNACASYCMVRRSRSCTGSSNI